MWGGGGGFQPPSLPLYHGGSMSLHVRPRVNLAIVWRLIHHVCGVFSLVTNPPVETQKFNIVTLPSKVKFKFGVSKVSKFLTCKTITKVSQIVHLVKARNKFNERFI